jgi:chromosome segregation ATPase
MGRPGDSPARIGPAAPKSRGGPPQRAGKTCVGPRSPAFAVGHIIVARAAVSVEFQQSVSAARGALLGEVYSGIETECASFAHYVEEMLCALETLRGQVLEKAHLVNEARQLLEERERELAGERGESGRMAHELEQQEARLRETQSRLEAALAELARREEESEAGREAFRDEEQARVNELIEERDALRSELDDANAELSRLAAVTAKLAETRQELAESRPELLEAHGQPPSGDVALQISELEQDRSALEAELELVRRKSSELSETLAEQRRQMAEERAEWAGELKQLRKLLERQSDVLARRYEALSHEDRASLASLGASLVPAARGAPAAGETETASPANSGRSPVVHSLMEQFAKLQQDASRRRKR